MKYIFITYDAITEFTQDRFLQNTGYEDGRQLCHILKGEMYNWLHRKIHVSIPSADGLIIHTDKIDKKKAFIFDLTLFHGFEQNSDEKIIMMFQRLLKYAVRYYEKMPLVNCEHELNNTNITIVYPFPFAASKGVEKVLVDRNSWKQNRKDRDFLTAFYYGTEENQKFTSTISNRALIDFDAFNFEETTAQKTQAFQCQTFSGNELNEIDHKISSFMLFDDWQRYLTIPQKQFIESEVHGVEFLKGAAGTGKTLSLVLRGIYLIKKYQSKNEEYHILFIVHSFAAKHRTIELFRQAFPEVEQCFETDGASRQLVSIKICTLQEWCAGHIGLNLPEENYLDPDASESKQLQLMYIEQAFDTCYNNIKAVAQNLFSEDFYNFISKKEDSMLEMIRDEIMIIIKGKAKEDRDTYLEIDHSKYNIPAKKDSDKKFIFTIYQYYRDALTKIGQYDTDDIVLTALGSINTPIWRRIQERDGYNACFIDETQLFNFNEAAVFHHVNKPKCENNIVFTIDQSQALGVNKIKQTDVINNISANFHTAEKQLDIVFRSSQGIIDLAYHILSSGSTVFELEFQNLMTNVESSFTSQEEKKTLFPSYSFSNDDNEMVKEAFAWVDKYCKTFSTPRSNILMVTTNEVLLDGLQKYAKSKNKSFDILTKRYDENQTLIQAQKGNRYVFGQIDYIGGLEFDAVIIIGTDDSRVPPHTSKYAAHFERHIWHSKLYVAITRAKYAVHLMGAPKGAISPILKSAIEEGLVKENNF